MTRLTDKIFSLVVVTIEYDSIPTFYISLSLIFQRTEPPSGGYFEGEKVMSGTTKFRVLEIIIQNRNAGFNATRVALMSGLPELSWEEITDYVALLKSEGYVKTLYGDNELCAVALQRGALARVRYLKENAENEKLKELLGRIIALLKISL